MSTDTITVSGLVPTDPDTLFAAFLDATAHARMTGAGATDEGDGRFTA